MSKTEEHIIFYGVFMLLILTFGSSVADTVTPQIQSNFATLQTPFPSPPNYICQFTDLGCNTGFIGLAIKFGGNMFGAIVGKGQAALSLVYNLIFFSGPTIGGVPILATFLLIASIVPGLEVARIIRGSSSGI